MELLKSLVGLQSVRSIKTVINYEHPVAIRWLKDVILSCPRLNVLHLRVPRDWQGQPNWQSDGLGSYDLSVEPGEKSGPLTELVYESTHPFSPPMIPVSFFDWTRLRRLELRGHGMYHLIKSLEGHQLVLESFKVEFIYLQFESAPDRNIPILEDFISSFRGLETLDLTSPFRQFPTSTISLHGNTLKHLSIHHPTRWEAVSGTKLVLPKPYSPADLDSLNDTCPHIVSLALDMGICGDLVRPQPISEYT